MRRISAHLLSTLQGLESGKVVTISDEGKILEISSPQHLDREAGVEFFPGVIVPGFINAHCHLELSHLRGAIPSGGGFTGFAYGMRSVRGGFADEERCTAAEFWDAKMWNEGVSAVYDICNGNSTFNLKLRSRIKYHSFCEFFGLGADPAHVFALKDEALVAGLSATITPHSTYSLSCEGFSAAVGNDNNRPLSVHFMESEDEVKLFRKCGAMWDWYAEQGFVPDFLDYGGPAERLVAQVPQDCPVMLIHNCVVTQRDIDIVMEHFSAPVTWVLCPGSNRYISGLKPPIGLLRKNDLRIAIGTDSLASNETLSVVRELSFIQDIPLAEMLGWVAADTIEVGHTPGLVLLQGVDFEKMSLTESTKSQRII
jgi:cytosine/adenosine deaminase-related metal-dependent hydrolase